MNDDSSFSLSLKPLTLDESAVLRKASGMLLETNRRQDSVEGFEIFRGIGANQYRNDVPHIG